MSRKPHSRPSRAADTASRLEAALHTIRTMAGQGHGKRRIASAIRVSDRMLRPFMARHGIKVRRNVNKIGSFGADAKQAAAVVTQRRRADLAFAAAMAGRTFDSYALRPAGRLHMHRPDPADGMGATALA